MQQKTEGLSKSRELAMMGKAKQIQKYTQKNLTHM